ncbi:hypothetical protein MVEN_00392100 [Mycena venus]|uniref:Nucleoside diphosphate kinase n=1 Tax=Mycena venus TaxID=2733690 RepID=A0A8H6YQ60_9AGAR|nr:hypothetical protein MVEN_00392100 [Mycena venus]
MRPRLLDLHPTRFDIERRIQEASFEIVKERQMEFDVESDPETLYELFGEDADSLGEGPVWVYVLERRRAVEVWLTLMGDRDPNVARQESPNSLRALYGTVFEQNALMGSPDVQTAEIQIASLFASSPPFPTSELPDADGKYASMRSMSSSVLDALRQTTSDEGYAPSNPSTTGQARLISNGNLLFKARPLPATHAAPDIVPRMTKAAALRTGQAVVTSGPSVPRAPLTKERLAKTFANVPGHKRAESIAVASTAAPTIAPPLRASKDSGPPSSFQFRPPTAPKLPGLSRSNSASSLGQNNAKYPSRPASAAGVGTPKAAPPPRARPSSVSVRPAAPRASILPNAKPQPARADSNASVPTSATSAENAEAPVRPKPRPSSISTPSIAPRTNRSAALRAAKQEAENAAAAKAAARKAGGRPSARPAPSASAIATF